MKTLASFVLKHGILKYVAAMPAGERLREMQRTSSLYLLLTFLSAIGTVVTAALGVSFVYLYDFHPTTARVLTHSEIQMCTAAFVLFTLGFLFLAVLGSAMRDLIAQRIISEAPPAAQP